MSNKYITKDSKRPIFLQKISIELCEKVVQSD